MFSGEWGRVQPVQLFVYIMCGHTYVILYFDSRVFVFTRRLNPTPFPTNIILFYQSIFVLSKKTLDNGLFALLFQVLQTEEFIFYSN